MIDVKENEPIAARRRMYFDIRGLDGLAVANGEDTFQPQISIDGAAWQNAGIGTLVLIGSGRYYADVDSAVLDSGSVILGRYIRGGNTVETPAQDSFRVVSFDPYDVIGAIAARIITDHGAGAYNGAGDVSGTAPGDQTIAIDGVTLTGFSASTYAQRFTFANFDPTGWSEVDFTIKRNGTIDDDSAAMILIRKIQAGGGGQGLILADGQIATAGNGAIVVTTGVNTLTIDVSINAVGFDVEPSPDDQPYVWEVTIWKGATDKRPLGTGPFVARRPVRRDVNAAKAAT